MHDDIGFYADFEGAYLGSLYKELEQYKRPSIFKDVILKMRDTNYPPQNIMAALQIIFSSHGSPSPILKDGLKKIIEDLGGNFEEAMEKAKEENKHNQRQLDAFLEEHFLDRSQPRINRRSFLRIAGMGAAGIVAAVELWLTKDRISDEDFPFVAFSLMLTTMAPMSMLPEVIEVWKRRKNDKEFNNDYNISRVDEMAKRAVLNIEDYDNCLYQRIAALRKPEPPGRRH
jgi:hypothetical protein